MSALAGSARNAQLDGFRALAIAFVIVAHAVRTASPVLDAGREALGEVGVSLFFVLSGFLITTLLVQERARTGTIALGAFYVRRLRRIFPAYYVFLAILTILSLTGWIAISARELAINAFYLRDYDVHPFSWLEHTWSLAVETQFYLIWPAVLLFAGNRAARLVAIAVVFLEPFVRLATYFAFPASRDLMSIAFHSRVDMLMFGCAVALMMEHGTPLWLETAIRRVHPSVSLLVLALCIVATARFRGAFQFTLGMSIEGAAIVLLLAGALLQPDAPFARVLKSAPATWVGRISYSLYLWQQPFLFPIGNSVAGRFPMNLVLAVGAAALSYYVVERAFFKPKPVPLPAT